MPMILLRRILRQFAKFSIQRWAGFTGRIIVAMTRDELFTYFAQRFSGVNKSQVVGLGTFGCNVAI